MFTIVQVNETATCHVMDRLAQYMLVFFANLTHDVRMMDECYADHSPSSLCNALICILPSQGHSVNLTFLPCSNPLGLHYQYVNLYNDTIRYATIYRSRVIDIDPYTHVSLLLLQHDPSTNTVAFEVSHYLLFRNVIRIRCCE